MNNEKTLLTSLFFLFFLLSGILIAIMIKKDLYAQENFKRNFQENANQTREENSWPKVEIEVRK